MESSDQRCAACSKYWKYNDSCTFKKEPCSCLVCSMLQNENINPETCCWSSLYWFIKQRSKVEFASLCTNIVVSVGKSAVKSFLPTLIHTLGMEAVLTAEEQLKKKAQSESRSPSDQSTRPTKPAASSLNSKKKGEFLKSL